MKQILIFKEKYGTRYFDASTLELRNAACFKILKERFLEGHWYDWMDEECQPHDPDILGDKQIAELPNENLRKVEKDRQQKLNRAMKNWQRNKNTYAKIKDCIGNEDFFTAYQILTNQSDGEYEGFNVEVLEQAP